MEHTELAVARSLVSDPTVFDSPVRWFANGQRGYRHGRSNCRKIRRNSYPAAVHETPQQAAVRACPDCYTDGLLHVIAPSSLTLARRVFSLMTGMRSGLEAVKSGSCKTDKYGLLLSEAKSVCDEVEHFNYRAQGDDAAGIAVSRLLSAAEELRSAAGQALCGKKPELVAAVAANITGMAHARNSTDGFTLHELTLLDPVGRESHWNTSSHAPGLRDVWLQAAQQHGSEAENRLQAMQAAAAKLTLQRAGQLAGLRPGRARPGEDAEKLAHRVWRAAVDEFVHALHARLESQYTSLVSQGTVVTVGLQAAAVTHRGSGLLGQVIAAFESATTADGTLVVMAMPPFMADWLYQQFPNRIGARSPVEIVPEETSPEEAGTAVALWTPQATRGEPYASLQACVSAAKALMR